MEEWFGLQPTGRQFREPTGVQHELVDGTGLRHTAIAFDPAWHGHPALTRDVELVRSFLEYPMVVGLVELSHADPARGIFVYPTGTVWTVKELLRIHADLGHAIGPRAALELCWLTGQVLLEAAENGGMQGCFSHGGLTPWRIALRADGDLQVLGYGLPQVDVIASRAAGAPFPEHDSLRYAPPERLTGVGEDPSADTLALTLVAYEVLTGKPLYDASDPRELHRAVSMSEGVTLLSRPNPLPRDIAQVFARALVFDPDSRLGGKAWLAEIETLLETHGQGEPLDAVVDRVRGAYRDGSRRGAKLRQAPTESFTPAQLQEAVDRAEPDDPAPKPEQRWSKAGRRRGPPTVAPPPAPPRPPPSPAAREALTADLPPSARAAAPEPTAGVEDLPRRRRRRNPDGSEGPVTADAGPPSLSLAEEETGPQELLDLELDPDDLQLAPEQPRRRLRRGDEPATGPATSPVAPTEPDPPRRRRRGE